MKYKFKFNWFAFISYSFAIFLCATGKVDWWVLIMVVLIGIEIKT